MKKVNKVYKRKREIELESIFDLKNKLHYEINKNKVDIDKSVFEKTPQERLELKVAKSKHKFAEYENN